jgi:hypothetical protein
MQWWHESRNWNIRRRTPGNIRHGLVTPLEVLRAVWTIGTGLGTLVMLALLREVLIDNWAISQITRPSTSVLRMTTRGEVDDQIIRLVAVASLFLAGLMTYAGQSTVVIALLCISAAAQVALGTVKLQRRRRLLRTLRLNRKAR